MRIAILQSNYIPWKGYFDLIRSVDEFVLFDDVQYTTHDWRNRNRIKTPHGTVWLTIPVASRGHLRKPIKDMVVSDPEWGPRHWRIIAANYAQARYFQAYAERFEQLFCDTRELHLSRINRLWIDTICDILGIRTALTWSMDYQLAPDRNERLVGICRQAGADTYVSGPAARAYLDEDAFKAAGITLEYFDYSGYPEYEQLYPPFEHSVSVIDLILNEGPRAIEYLQRT